MEDMIIDGGLIAQLAKERTLNTMFERQFFKDRQRNPVTAAIKIADQQIAQRYALAAFLAGVLALMAIGALGLELKYQPNASLAGWLGFVWIWCGVAVTAAMCIAFGIVGHIADNSARDKPGRYVLDNFLADLNEVYCWRTPEGRRGRADAIEFLTSQRNELTKAGTEIVHEGARAVVANQGNVSGLNSVSVTFDGELRRFAERRYYTSKRLGMVAEGALVRAYDEQERQFRAEQRLARAEPVDGIIATLPREMVEPVGGIKDSSS